MKPFVIAITGGSGSGKTTLANLLQERIGPERVTLFPLDRYYKDLSHLKMEERETANFDHPNAVDLDLFKQHLKLLIEGKSVEAPIYSFVTHTRTGTEIIKPNSIIITEGLFVLYDEELRSLMNIKIFIDTPSDIRLIRRIQRDVVERGDDVETVMRRWIQYVRMGYEKYVEPTKRFADIIVEGYPKMPIDELFREIKKFI